MVNFKFFKLHIKNIWIILLLFCLASIILICANIIGNKTLSPLDIISENSDSGTAGAGATFAAIIIASNIFLSFLLSIILINKFFNKEINQGYIGSWLSLPLSRMSIFVTKTFTIVISLIIYFFSSFMFQEIIYASTMLDFNAKIALFLFVLNFTMFLVGFLFASFAIFASLYINKIAVSLTIISVLAAVFYVFYLTYCITPTKDNIFYPLQYMTIISFSQSAMSFDFNNPIKIIISDSSYKEYYPAIISYGNLWWKILAPIVGSVPFVLLSMFNFKNKNFVV